MHHRPRARRLTCWLAVLTLLLAGILPGIARAVVVASDDGLIEVCTAHGSKWFHVDGTPVQHPAQQDGLHAHADCLSCCLHAPMAAPPVPLSPHLDPLARHGAPAPLATTPPTWLAWIAALPRAPPAWA